MIMTHHPTSARVLWYETQLLVGQPNGGSPKFQGDSPKLFFFSHLFVSLLFTQQSPQVLGWEVWGFVKDDWYWLRPYRVAHTVHTKPIIEILKWHSSNLCWWHNLDWVVSDKPLFYQDVYRDIWQKTVSKKARTSEVNNTSVSKDSKVKERMF